MWFWHSRTLKKLASIVLASFRPSTYLREYASGLHSLRPCWTNFLSVLRGSVLLSKVGAVEAHPPVPFAVMGVEGRGKARSSFSITIVMSIATLTVLSGCALFAPREEVRLKQATS
jgi:hypothetical protein